MPRIACLSVADFPLAALLRAEPDLRGRPLATADADEPRAPLTAVSPEAAALGLRPGISTAQARTISSRLLLRVPSPQARRSAAEALLDVADSFSPRVESGEEGVVFLEIDGLRSLFGTESHLATSLGARLRRVGLDGRVGVASTKIAAWLAARGSAGGDVLPAGQERRMLAATPISAVAPPGEIAFTLERWGIRTLGALAALPATAVGWRFGEAGLRLWRSARGEDDRPLAARPRPARFEESVDCGYAVDSFEPLSFLLRAALERLTARLDVRGLRAGDLTISLGLDDGGRERRTVAVAAPTNEVKTLLALVRLQFDRQPPRAAVAGFALSAAAEPLRPVELDLFAPAGPTPQDLDLAVARLTAMAGTGRVGRPVVIDSHRPEAFAVERFSLAAGQRPPPPSDPAGGQLPVPPTATIRRSPAAAAHLTSSREDAKSSRSRSVLALRAFRPPATIEVACDRGRPDFVRAGGEAEKFGGRVVGLAGPWRVSAEWWRDSSFARDYYDAELSDGCVYRIYREHGSGEWFADGVYD